MGERRWWWRRWRVRMEMSKSASSDPAPVLELQGVNAFIRKAASSAPVSLDITQKGTEEYFIKQSTTASIPGISEEWYPSRPEKWVEGSDQLLGKSRSRSKWGRVGELEGIAALVVLRAKKSNGKKQIICATHPKPASDPQGCLWVPLPRVRTETHRFSSISSTKPSPSPDLSPIEAIKTCCCGASSSAPICHEYGSQATVRTLAGLPCAVAPAATYAAVRRIKMPPAQPTPWSNVCSTEEDGSRVSATRRSKPGTASSRAGDGYCVSDSSRCDCRLSQRRAAGADREVDADGAEARFDLILIDGGVGCAMKPFSQSSTVVRACMPLLRLISSCLRIRRHPRQRVRRIPFIPAAQAQVSQHRKT